MVRLIVLRFLESYFRHRWLYLIPILIMSIAGALTLFVTSEYTARGVIFIQGESLLGSLTSLPRDGFGFETPAQATSQELYELLATDAFIRSLVLETSFEEYMAEGQTAMADAFEEVRETIWVEPRGENQIVIFASHEDPVLAYQLVSATIESYIQWQINLDLNESRVAEEFFKDLTATYQSDLEQARSEMEVFLSTHPDPPQFQSRPASEMIEIDRLQANIDMAAERYTATLTNLENARLATAQSESNVRQSYLLIDAPLLPETPETSLQTLAVTGAIFVVLGVVISGIAVVGSALLDRSVHFPIDVYHTLELPVLATVPAGVPVAAVEEDEVAGDTAVSSPSDATTTESTDAAVEPAEPEAVAEPESDDSEETIASDESEDDSEETGERVYKKGFDHFKTTISSEPEVQVEAAPE